MGGRNFAIDRACYATSPIHQTVQLRIDCCLIDGSREASIQGPNEIARTCITETVGRYGPASAFQYDPADSQGGAQYRWMGSNSTERRRQRRHRIDELRHSDCHDASQQTAEAVADHMDSSPRQPEGVLYRLFQRARQQVGAVCIESEPIRSNQARKSAALLSFDKKAGTTTTTEPSPRGTPNPQYTGDARSRLVSTPCNTSCQIGSGRGSLTCYASKPLPRRHHAHGPPPAE